MGEKKSALKYRFPILHDITPVWTISLNHSFLYSTFKVHILQNKLITSNRSNKYFSNLRDVQTNSRCQPNHSKQSRLVEPLSSPPELNHHCAFSTSHIIILKSNISGIIKYPSILAWSSHVRLLLLPNSNKIIVLCFQVHISKICYIILLIPSLRALSLPHWPQLLASHFHTRIVIMLQLVELI